MSNNFAISFEQLEELIGLVNQVHGFSFNGYTRASLKRRITRIMQLYNLSFFDLKALLINKQDFFEEFLTEITVNVTEMFRDPHFFSAVRKKVFPYLASYQRIKIWNAGCSSGEELYSFAIMLEEEDLYSRSFLYGTDINSKVLDFAKKGIYDLRKMKQNSENYQQAGASSSLSDYYTAVYDAASIQHRLKQNTLFSVHNLVSDGVFNEFQLISCRNVLIYFNAELQRKVIRLFYDSLCPLGFLCLGSKETLRGDELASRFRVVDQFENIYQKIA
ncbi:CheR family methyltransferase [Hufsiella ginkgonis]|uniref:Protein-glutamate O-methyltransferase CheR n=1 Tax=Hufsiella ginkgonis TaxID=2695274 RepID=A0A7K1XVS1_9SPHI|nr:protein-glutamate O-methyltransferase CheR [Hufsiella ginkgonis]MXV15095.1 protein-glutamate O-methyltransferase CheR [Hufsiella ginkgonis]